jgi:hypothetical protein
MVKLTVFILKENCTKNSNLWYNNRVRNNGDAMALHDNLMEETDQRLSLGLVAALTGLSQRAFRRQYIATGRLKLLFDGTYHLNTFYPGRPYIHRELLEDVVGRRFTPEEMRTAERKLMTRRRSARTYGRLRGTH